MFFIKKNAPRRQTRHRGQDDELLLEAHQLDLKDDPAPPGTLGAELRLHLGKKKPAALVAFPSLLVGGKHMNLWQLRKKRTKIHMSAIDLVI